MSNASNLQVDGDLRAPLLARSGLESGGFAAPNGARRSPSTWTCAAALSLLLLLPTTTRAQSPPKGAEGFNAFRLLRTRNVFDPERRAVVSDAAAPKPQPTVPRANFIALTGTMVSREKTLAFFTGSRPEYSKVITVGDSIGDFKVAAITATQVELTLAGKPLTVLIGRQVPLAGSSVASGPPPVLPPPTTAAAPTPPPSGNPNAPAADKNETLRRMMEARQKEMSK